MEKCRVLVVDDEEQICILVAKLLSRSGYTVLTATNGPDALAHLREGFRGLILMDINMPQMSGWQTIRQMADEGLVEGNCICMLTGLIEPGPGANGLEECVMDYLVKPVPPGILLDVARQASESLSQ